MRGSGPSHEPETGRCSLACHRNQTQSLYNAVTSMCLAATSVDSVDLPSYCIRNYMGQRLAQLRAQAAAVNERTVQNEAGNRPAANLVFLPRQSHNAHICVLTLFAL